MISVCQSQNNVCVQQKTKQLSQCETTAEHHSACQIQDKCGGSSFSLGPLFIPQICPSVCPLQIQVSKESLRVDSQECLCLCDCVGARGGWLVSAQTE